jgi:SAM-dependent methyltransferase
MRALAAQNSVSWTDANGARHDGPIAASEAGYDIITCTACGFRHAVPLPSAQDLERAYRETYYADEKPTFLAHAAEDQEWNAMFQHDRLDMCEGLLPRERRRFLDIGSGPGFFLKTAKERGWDVKGIEPSRQAAQHARDLGLDVREGFFGAETAPSLRGFDVVHLNNVLEHVPDPENILRLARDCLSPGGVICVGVPNDFVAFQEAARAELNLKQWWVAPPHHLNYFDFASLASLLERCGFKERARTTSFPMEMFLMMGRDHTNDKTLGRANHTERKNFDLALEHAGFREARRAFYRALAASGMGREAVLIAQRED